MKARSFIVASLVGALVASNAFATVARQVVLGGNPVFTSTAGLSGGATVVVPLVTGALWYDDDYNVFFNPSYVMDNKNYAVVQKGLEGGFFQGVMDNFAYGVYYNRGGNNTPGQTYADGHLVTPGIRANARYMGTGYTGINTQRPIDFFIAGDTGVKWGLRVTHAYNRDQSTITRQNGGSELTARYWHFNLGAQAMGFEPFVGATLFTNMQDTTTLGRLLAQDQDEFYAGVRYKYEGWTPYVMYKHFRESGTPLSEVNSTLPNATVATQRSHRNNVWSFGVGHNAKVADGVHVLKHIGYAQSSVDGDSASNVAQQQYIERVLPFNLAIEAEATSWLTLRAGAEYDFMRERQFERTTRVASTDAGQWKQSLTGSRIFVLGSTFKFGKLAVDSAFGNGTGVATSNGTAISGDAPNVGFDSQTFAFVSASYRW